jgi:hypothetical protein
VLDGASSSRASRRAAITLCRWHRFFNLQNPLGRVLPSLFAEQLQRKLGVTDPPRSSTRSR